MAPACPPRRVRARSLGPILALLLAAACSKAGEESRTKRSPTAPPPPTVEIPPQLSIAVTIDGTDAPALDAARLAAIPADFVDTERRAWRLTTLVPAFDAPGRTIEAVGPSGMTLKLDRPTGATATAPVLFLTRRGDVVVTVLDPAQPFPDYHGQGGRLRRPGDTQPHLSPVSALRVAGAP
ncbi:MAG: hypothetical protein IPL61_14485 [Myxococcales bacterium]|nr:hypothetical protein [Myxococcales bacterium]